MATYCNRLMKPPDVPENRQRVRARHWSQRCAADLHESGGKLIGRTGCGSTWNRSTSSDELWSVQTTLLTADASVSGKLPCQHHVHCVWCSLISLANVDRFSYFFHQLTRRKILHAQTTKISTSPATCCYTTLWISKMLLILTASAANCWSGPADTLSTRFNIYDTIR